MAVPVFRAEAHTAYGSTAGSVTCAKPTGTVDGDIMVAVLVQGRSGSIASVPTPPSGWAQTASYTTVNDGGFYGRCSVWWKRAASEGVNYAWTLAETVSTQVIICSYSGCLASGNPVDVTSTNSANIGVSATATALSVTTTVAETKLIYTGHNWDGGGTRTPPSGMTERYDSLAYFADQNIASAGATGNRTQALVDANPWAAFLVALKPAAGGGGGGGKPVKVWSGSAWVTKPVKVWSGSAWVTKPAKVWNGSAWV